ncbi:ABC transporter permease [Anaerorhabdus sp.]|jgi:general nucleoside transport system permease protein|uniref:ABC transporter permease n=1 Tax=Anaerorhabdus sp. TaxID=1872524 RepID=UPI002FC59E6B
MDFVNSIPGILSSMLFMSIPLILAALGGVFSVRAGIMALGLESMILTGAFTAVVGAYFSGNAWVGFACGILGGMFFGLCHGVLSIKYKVNQVISGIGLNLLATATTTLLMQIIWGNKGSSASVPSIQQRLTFLKDIPVIGDIFAKQSVVLIFTVILALLSWVILFKTPFGLQLRMVGENPKAASSVGIPVKKMKYIGVILCGALAGMAGAYLSIDNLNLFVRDMSASRGYIAVAIAILSRYNPLGVLLCGGLFGLCDAIQIYAQGYGIPSQLVQMIPYIVTLIVLTIGVKNIQPPAGVGKYEDE